MFRTRAFAVIASVASLLAASQAWAQTQVARKGQTVATGAQGTQVLFPDKTSLSAGSNSEVKVRRVDYDRQAGTANVVIEVAKGAVRYVTGNSNGSHTIKTPLSTVGVRGTVIEGYVDTFGNEIFVLIEGAFEVCTATGGCQQVTTPGTFVIVSPTGAVSPAAPIPPSMMSALLLVTPSLDLLKEVISVSLNGGSDPLVTFRDLSTARPNPLPPAVPRTIKPPSCGECYED